MLLEARDRFPDAVVEAALKDSLHVKPLSVLFHRLPRFRFRHAILFPEHRI